MASSPPPNETLLFRPRKKRKVYKQRADDEDEDSVPQNLVQSIDELISQEAEAVPVSMAEILRLRKRKQKGGVEFRATGNMIRDEDGQLVLREDDGAKVAPVVSRFSSQTGHVGDVNKHMMAYIDTQMEKQRNKDVPRSPIGFNSATFTDNSKPQISHRKEIDVRTTAEAQGKLAEIDLGEEARLKNIELTERAKRKLAGEEEPMPPPPQKIRLGPDGKPWRGRQRKQRTEEDIQRDKMVENLFKENTLGLYEEPPPERESTGNDEAADDRIADAFRKEFMNAKVSDQRQKKAKPVPSTARGAAAKVDEALLKGPKLGGGRSQRAAMRESMLREESKKK